MKLNIREVSYFNYSVASRLHGQMKSKEINLEELNYHDLIGDCGTDLNDLEDMINDCFKRKDIYNQAIEIAIKALLMAVKTMED